MEVSWLQPHVTEELQHAEVFSVKHSLSMASSEEGHPCLALFAGFVLAFSHGYCRVRFSKAALQGAVFSSYRVFCHCVSTGLQKPDLTIDNMVAVHKKICVTCNWQCDSVSFV